MTAHDNYLLGIDTLVETAAMRAYYDERFDIMTLPVVEVAPADEPVQASIPMAVKPQKSNGKIHKSSLVPFYDGSEESPISRPHMVLQSVLPKVSDEAWTDFALVIKNAAPDAISASNALGMFEMKPRRLADLGLMKNTYRTQSSTKRMIWIGEFVPPMTQKLFLADPKIQYKAFTDSMVDYVTKLRAGQIPKPDGGRPDGMTLSGALAVMHRCGPQGLKTWNDLTKRFESTVALYQRANGIF